MKGAQKAVDQFVTLSHDVQSRFFSGHRAQIIETADRVADRLRDGGKVLLFGNGGSASNAQHLAAEFVGRFIPDRAAVPALSLATDTSVLTAIGNDYGYDHIFSRQIEALANDGDTAIAISTSGNSPNVLVGIDAARERGLYTLGLTGKSGGKMLDRVDVLFRVPSEITPRIQETHILLGHVMCELIDRSLFPEAYDD